VSDPIFNITARSTRYQGIEDAIQGTDVELQQFIRTDKGMWERLSSCIADNVRTAIYAFSGDCIFDVMEFLKVRHISVPEQVGVVGYDGSPWTRLIVPEITAIEQDPIAIGKRSATDLLELMNDPGREPEIITVESYLRERQSL
jgi:DNA-binding LacI/PurR family transcriptional regulator